MTDLAFGHDFTFDWNRVTTHVNHALVPSKEFWHVFAPEGELLAQQAPNIEQAKKIAEDSYVSYCIYELLDRWRVSGLIDGALQERLLNDLEPSED
jgi:hypothetical protein